MKKIYRHTLKNCTCGYSAIGGKRWWGGVVLAIESKNKNIMRKVIIRYHLLDNKMGYELKHNGDSTVTVVGSQRMCRNIQRMVDRIKSRLDREEEALSF